MLQCANCRIDLSKYQKKYCSNLCQKEFEYKIYISNWKSGNVSGSRGVKTRNFSGHVIRYLKDKYGSRCSQCGWNKVNEVTNRCPLELDHIDGNPSNNAESNLRLLCPNCHSLTSTYKNLNYGKGRLWRREKYVKIVKSPL